jgi:uncharacterized membrane protein YfbV (UPF0208 family)
MKKLSWIMYAAGVVAIIALAAMMTGCCAAEKNAASNVRSTQELILPDYLKYVEADAALTVAQKDDRKKLADSLRRLTDQLKKSLGE